MSSPKQNVAALEPAEETVDTRDVYLREGRTLRVSEQGADQLVEIRSESGQLELRVALTEQGPILHMESVRLSIKASESVAIESRQVSIHGSEQLALHGGEVGITAERDLKVNAGGEVRIVGTMIYLN